MFQVNDEDTRTTSCRFSVFIVNFNPFVPSSPFLYPLKTLENLTVFFMFQEVEKVCIGNEWIKHTSHLLLVSLLLTSNTQLSDGNKRKKEVMASYDKLWKFLMLYNRNLCQISLEI